MPYGTESEKASIYRADIIFSENSIYSSEIGSFVYTPDYTLTELEAKDRFQEIIDFFATLEPVSINAYKQNTTTEVCTPTEPE